jgi:DNA polymerase-3 subunit delta
LPAERPGSWRTIGAGEDGERLGQALEDLASPSLFGGMQVLCVRQADTLRDEDQARVLAALPALGAGGCLVLVARSADQRRRLLAACVRAGAAFGFPALTDPRAVEPWVIRLARERGHEITPAAARELVERSGLDLGVLAGEMEKVSLHAGAGVRIEPAHVQAVVAAVRTHGIDELTDRLTRRDAAGAALALRQLLDEGEPPIRVLAFLGANVRRALHVSELAAAGLSGDEIARRLAIPPWLVGRIGGRGKPQDLVRTLMVLRRLDLELKSARESSGAFEAALLEIVAAQKSA